MDWSNFWSVIWLFFWSFAFVAYLFALFAIISDLFRDHKLNGWWKALWIIALIFVPFLTGLIYVIARGKGIAQRQYEARARVVREADDYAPAASSSPAADIARAKELLDAGTISQGEFDALKSKALGNQYFGA